MNKTILLPAASLLCLTTALACEVPPPPAVPEAQPPAPTAPGANANEVSAEALAPRLLKDSEETASYLKGFPLGEYKIFAVGKHRFVLDHLPDFIKNHIRHGMEWEPHLSPHFKVFPRPGTTVIDAGAHIGTHTVTMAEAVGPEGRVYAFEPQKKLHRELHYNLILNKMPQARALRYALGDEPGVIEMAKATKRNEGATGIGKGGDKAELRTLDSFGFKNVSFIKIDVESFEIPVIKGATELIKRERPVILVEIMAAWDADSAPAKPKKKIEETKKLLEDLGYVVKRAGIVDYLALPKERYLRHDMQPGEPIPPDEFKKGTKAPAAP
jgi:FkbM family methyltransferase